MPNRQHLQIAPNRRRPAKERLFWEILFQPIQIVTHPKRPLASRAKIVDLVSVVMFTAICAFQMRHEIHPRHSNCRKNEVKSEHCSRRVRQAVFWPRSRSPSPQPSPWALGRGLGGGGTGDARIP